MLGDITYDPAERPDPDHVMTGDRHAMCDTASGSDQPQMAAPLAHEPVAVATTEQSTQVVA